MPGLSESTFFNLPMAPSTTGTSTIPDNFEILSACSDVDAQGAISTRTEVADFILDLIGYDTNEPLHQKRILEPSFGEGAFLFPIIDRLLLAWRKHGGSISVADRELAEAICGVELHQETFFSTRNSVINRLKKEGISTPAASELANRWLIKGDFLLEKQNGCFNYVAGNPPYVRQELISAPLLTEYRHRYKTMYDRADLYIPFIERSLSLLSMDGSLGFICTDRWMKNRYGGPLRKFIAENFHLKAYIDMVDTDAFNTKVSTYPAIVVLTKNKSGATRVARRPKIEKKNLSALATEIKSETLTKNSPVREVVNVLDGSEPWILDSSADTLLIRRIESHFPTIEQVGCKIGIGVATGADKAFIGDFESLEVEPDRKLPLVTTKDIQSGEVIWQGQGVINPFTDSGCLVDLQVFPKLARYLEKHKTIIAGRHCARKAPEKWYRTIDRIWPELTSTPKLLIPDIKGEAHIVFEPGKLYPHHNLYYVISDTWDIRALQAVLLSSIAKLFVANYSTKIRGGYLRFQAQYLRRIRIPFWHDVPKSLRQDLIHAAITRDIAACNRAVFKLYEINHDERSTLGNNGK